MCVTNRKGYVLWRWNAGVNRYIGDDSSQTFTDNEKSAGRLRNF